MYFSVGNSPGGSRLGGGGCRTHVSPRHASDADRWPIRRAGARLGQRRWCPGDRHGGRERKHRIAEEYMATHSVGVVFLVVPRASATVWKRDPAALGCHRRRGEEYRVRHPLLFPHPRSGPGQDTMTVSITLRLAAKVMFDGHEDVACAGRGQARSTSSRRATAYRADPARAPGPDRRHPVRPALRSFRHAPTMCAQSPVRPGCTTQPTSPTVTWSTFHDVSADLPRPLHQSGVGDIRIID